jgi:energy-coupling factor transporter ATP-binding protein EcfA2
VESLSLFEVENLTYYYPETERPALHNVNLTIEEGEFLLVVGGSGSGKSSLARALAGLIPDFYGGRIGGKVRFKKNDLRTMDRRSLAREVGIVFQDPEKQLVMTGVEAEVAFGLENLGLPQAEMFRRVAEVMSFLGLTHLKTEFTSTLSGGQKQKLALAAVLAMQPRVLLLDEPTSQLDPAAAEEFFNLLKRLNEEMNLTIVLVEQRLDRCFHLADRVAVMENGTIVREGLPGAIAAWQAAKGLPYVPPVAAFFAHAGSPGVPLTVVPLTVKEGRRLVKEFFFSRYKCAGTDTPRGQQELAPARPGGKPVIEIKDLWFAYPNGREALRGINLSAGKGEFVALMGENAAGKTTLLKQLAGLLKPARGRVLINGSDTRKTTPHQLARHVGYLSQNPNDYLFQDTVAEELHFTLRNLGLPDEGRVDRLLDKLGLTRQRQNNPRDLSSGERQRVALASVMVAGPQLLVLDEPTRGLDYGLKAGLGSLLQEIAGEGTTIVTVTHDVEFAAEYACRVVMLFDGRIACDGPKHMVLGSSMFYAPQISRLFQDVDNSVLTFREALEKLRFSLISVAECAFGKSRS